MVKQIIVDRLVLLGYEMKPEDELILPFVMDKVLNNIKNSCNITSIPEGLMATAIDMVCGEFLFLKNQTGQLESFDSEIAIKKVSLGDTDVTFGDSLSSEQRLDNLINYLMTNGKGDFVCYRKIKW